MSMYLNINIYICVCVGSIIRNILVYILYRNETRALETRSTGYNIESRGV